MTEKIIRPYQPDDLLACRELWVVLTQKHRDIYDDQTIGGDDPGNYFDEHLKEAGAENIWLCEVDGLAVGMTSLIKTPYEGWEIEPVVVKPEYRGQGIGRKLIEYVIDEARSRGLKSLSIRPVFRNKEAIATFHKIGFDKIGAIELFMELGEKPGNWKPGAKIHDLDLEY